MKVNRVINSRTYTNNSHIVGIGTTAVCYKIKDGRILKLYRNTARKEALFKYRNNMYEFLHQLSTINNDSYVGPEEIILDLDDNVIGYILSEVKGVTFKKMPSNIKISVIESLMPRIQKDTYKVSQEYYQIYDMHLKNIMYDSSFKLIDLDGGNFQKDILSKESVYKKNMYSIRKVIIDSIYKGDVDKIIEFKDSSLQSKYKEMLNSNNNELFNEFLEYLAEINKINNPTIKDLRKNKDKVLTLNKINNYYM